MSVIKEILAHQLDKDLFGGLEAEEAKKVKGIALRAVKEGYDTLSDAQKYVLKPFLSQPCYGYDNPAEHIDCDRVLEGQALLDAYQDADDPECLQCESCRAERDYIANHREKFFRD